VVHFLGPTLKRGQIVVMDNLKVHKMKRVRELIEGVGALRPCSCRPTLPTSRRSKRPSSKVKGILRRIGVRTRETLLVATSEALEAVSRREMPLVGSDIAATRSPITRYEKRSRTEVSPVARLFGNYPSTFRERAFSSGCDYRQPRD
jgi:hypothetical protein